MRKQPPLPPIAIEESPEKLAVSLPKDLKRSLEAFSEYFTTTTGSKPTSFNAVVVGILAGYLQGHAGYQKWIKMRGAANVAQDPT